MHTHTPTHTLFTAPQANSVVYLNKKIEFCASSIRTQVYEMWAQGGKVACGVVTENTKVRLV